MTGLGSLRASIPGSFSQIVTLFLFLAPFYYQVGVADADHYPTAKWNVPAKASASSELQVGDLYAVVVGVSKYKDARIPALSVSDKDARSIAEFFKTQKNLFKDIHVSLLVNEDATREALETELYYKIRRAGKDDTVIIFLSGHGTDDPKNPGEFFFLPFDANSEFVAVGGIHMNRQWFVDKLDSKRVLIIADACHAGGFAGSGVKRLPPSLDKFMGQFKESEGRVFITSSRADEYSKETPELGHSLFTHFLLEGLGGNAADKDGVVTLKSLYDYVYKMTKKASDGFQSPQMEGKLVGTFPVALVRADIPPIPHAAPQKPTPAATDPIPVNLKNSALQPEEYVVTLDVSIGGVEVKVIHDREVKRSFHSDIKSSDLERDVAKFREGIRGLRLRDYDPELAKSLYNKLLRPALVGVPKGAPLIVIPDGILEWLPFEALVTTGEAVWKQGQWGDYPEGLTFFADEHPISYYHSITALNRIRTRVAKNNPNDRLLIIADPVFEMRDSRINKYDNQYERFRSPEENKTTVYRDTVSTNEESRKSMRFARLAQTSVLADNLKKIYGSKCLALIGLDARKDKLLSQIGPGIDQFGNIVLATHGVFSGKTYGIMEPVLILTMVPPGIDGFLKISEILSHKMNAEVIAFTVNPIFSVDVLASGGIIKIGRDLQYAGAKSVLTAQWNVAEQSTVMLFEDFFKYRKEGKTKLQALQAARDNLRKAGCLHPFFWAPFILIGETS